MNMSEDQAYLATKPFRARSDSIRAAKLDELVLSALRGSPVPLSAYALADRLRDEGYHAVIPSIYRAVGRLEATGAIEKVEMLSAYRIGEREKHLCLVCLKCGETTGHPIPELYGLLLASVKDAGFDIAKVALELAGCCQACRDRE